MSDGPLEQAARSAMQRAELLVASDRETEALALLGEALRHTPEHPQLLSNYSWVLNRLNRPAEALEYADRALSFAPELLQGQFQRAYAEYGLGESALAEDSALRGLELDPEHVEFHLLYARLTASAPGKGRQKKARRALTVSHLDTALELSPENPDTLCRAAEVTRMLGNTDLANHYVSQGLALAPEHVQLLTLRASLVTETVQTGGRYDIITQPTVALAEANKLLQLDPQHVGARRTLFSGLWYERILFTDGPLTMITVLALSYGVTYQRDGHLWSPWMGAGLVLLFSAIRLAKGKIISSPVNQGFIRSIAQETRFAITRRVLVMTAWCVVVIGALCQLFVRDAVIVRWLIVALSLGTLASLVAALLLHAAHTDAARRLGGYGDDVNSLVRLAGERRLMRSHLWFRLLGLLGVAIGSLAIAQGRKDSVAVAFVAIAGLILSLTVGLLITQHFERSLRAELAPGTVVLKETYRAPSWIGIAMLGAVSIGAIAILATNLGRVPMLPNEYDAIGHYEVAEKSDNADDDTCNRGGRRGAGALACIIERQQAQADREWPKIEVPDFNVPDFNVPDSVSSAQAQ